MKYKRFLKTEYFMWKKNTNWKMQYKKFEENFVVQKKFRSGKCNIKILDKIFYLKKNC